MRPCFLVIDREFSSGISSRKLVIETAKFNVITAYSSDEAIETLKTFPAVNGVVLDRHMGDMSCDELVSRLKKVQPGLPVVAIGDVGACGRADYYVDSFSPAQLLKLLQKLWSVETTVIEARSRELSASEADSPKSLSRLAIVA